MPQPQVPLPLSSTYLGVFYKPDIFIQTVLPPLISLPVAAQGTLKQSQGWRLEYIHQMEKVDFKVGCRQALPQRPYNPVSVFPLIFSPLWMTAL